MHTEPSRIHPQEVRIDEVSIRIGAVALGGALALPAGASGIVLFAHGSGSSRHSPRNRYVAEGIREFGLGTLLFDLLTDDEARDRSNVFDIPLLAQRLIEATRWVQARARRLRVGYFGASTGAAAALRAAAELGEDVSAIVSRGGRPDLAMDVLGNVTAPTLLIVGEHDVEVLMLNRRAYDGLICERELRIVSGATHLFEEEGALEEVMRHARAWFRRHLAGG